MQLLVALFLVHTAQESVIVLIVVLVLSNNLSLSTSALSAPPLSKRDISTSASFYGLFSK